MNRVLTIYHYNTEIAQSQCVMEENLNFSEIGD